MLYQVTLSYACFGIEVDEKTHFIINAPPIARWMTKDCHTLERVKDWVEYKGGTIVVMPEDKPDHPEGSFEYYMS